MRRKIRELKKASGQAVGSMRRGDAAYRRPGTGMKGPSLKPVSASTVHHGGSFLPSSTSPAKVSAAGAPKRALSPAVDSAKQEAVSPSSSLPSSRKSSQSVESKDSLARPQAGGSRDQTASPVGSANEPLVSKRQYVCECVCLCVTTCVWWQSSHIKVPMHGFRKCIPSW